MAGKKKPLELSKVNITLRLSYPLVQELKKIDKYNRKVEEILEKHLLTPQNEEIQDFESNNDCSIIVVTNECFVNANKEVKPKMDNETAKGYLLKALNFLIDDKHLTSEQAEQVMSSFHSELDLTTEGQAKKYYKNNFIKKVEE